jgi:hypothetical protein
MTPGVTCIAPSVVCCLPLMMPIITCSSMSSPTKAVA